jgi:nucleotide-binding universal stress UspA family protein
VLHVSDGRAPDGSKLLLDFLALHETAGLTWEVATRKGDVVEHILADAAARRPDLIVLGSRGHSGPVPAAVGGVADRVIREARCDVLVAHRPRHASN